MIILPAVIGAISSPVQSSGGGSGLSANCTAAWKFEDNLTAAVGGLNLSGYNDSTSADVTFTDGATGLGRALSFDNYDSVTHAAATALNFTNTKFAIAVVFKAGDKGTIVSNADSGGSDSYAIGVDQVGFGSNRKIRFYVNADYSQGLQTGNITVGNQLLVAAWNDPSGSMGLYCRDLTAGTDVYNSAINGINATDCTGDFFVGAGGLGTTPSNTVSCVSLFKSYIFSSDDLATLVAKPQYNFA